MRCWEDEALGPGGECRGERSVTFGLNRSVSTGEGSREADAQELKRAETQAEYKRLSQRAAPACGRAEKGDLIESRERGEGQRGVGRAQKSQQAAGLLGTKRLFSSSGWICD
jgi:hypothetical protein